MLKSNRAECEYEISSSSSSSSIFSLDSNGDVSSINYISVDSLLSTLKSFSLSVTNFLNEGFGEKLWDKITGELVARTLITGTELNNKEPMRIDLIKHVTLPIKYVFLARNNTLPIIIANSLSVSEKENLISVLKTHKRAIGWALTYIPGIDVSVCTHKILLKERVKPIKQQQRRLNPLISDVIKKEVTKLLNASIIYPNLDSEWVSLVYVVPKKSGITIVRNEKNELIPTRVHNSWRVCIDYRKLNDATVGNRALGANHCLMNIIDL